MNHSGRLQKIEGKLSLGFGQAQVVHNFWDEPIDVSGRAQTHHIELSLLPSSVEARASFVDHWGPDRFEPIGEVFFLPADHLVHAKSNCRHQNSIICSLNPEAVNDWFDKQLAWTDLRLRTALNIPNGEIRRLLLRMGEEIRAPGFASEAMVELLAAQTIIELYRFVSGVEEGRISGGLSPWCLRLIDERLEDDYVPPSLKELAELCHLSVRHLTRAFRASRGRSIGSHIAERRLDHARRLLATGRSVKAVAYDTGFSAPSNFTAAFVKATGETPRQYRLRASGRSAGALPLGGKLLPLKKEVH
jgi:AraC family transcriptional regulator